MDACREAVAPRSGVLKWLLRHRRCRPMTAGGSGASAARDGRPVTRGMLPVAIAGVVVVCRYGACGMTNDTCFIHCALSDDCRATAHCNSSLGVSTSTYRISTSLVCAPGPYTYTHHTHAEKTGVAPPSRAAEAPEPPAVIGRHLLCRRSHFNTPDLGATASLQATRSLELRAAGPPRALAALQPLQSQHLHIGPSSQLGSCLNRHPTRQ